MRIGEQDDFFLTEDFLFELAVVFLDGDTSARILCNYVLVERGKYHFLEASINRVGAFAGEAVDEILGERAHQILGQLFGLHFQSCCLFLPFGYLFRIIFFDRLLFFLSHVAFDFFGQQSHFRVNQEVDEHSASTTDLIAVAFCVAGMILSHPVKIVYLDLFFLQSVAVLVLFEFFFTFIAHPLG